QVQDSKHSARQHSQAGQSNRHAIHSLALIFAPGRNR
ncbi:MAG: hypothetical protein ACI87H_003761, partial [Gammaproteobacteria bacterium]